VARLQRSAGSRIPQSSQPNWRQRMSRRDIGHCSIRGFHSLPPERNDHVDNRSPRAVSISKCNEAPLIGTISPTANKWRPPATYVHGDGWIYPVDCCSLRRTLAVRGSSLTSRELRDQVASTVQHWRTPTVNRAACTSSGGISGVCRGRWSNYASRAQPVVELIWSAPPGGRSHAGGASTRWIPSSGH